MIPGISRLFKAYIRSLCYPQNKRIVVQAVSYASSNKDHGPDVNWVMWPAASGRTALATKKLPLDFFEVHIT